MVLKILDGSSKAVLHEYCSAYGKGSARLVTDGRGRAFVLLDYSEGHGTHVTVDYLRVDEIVGDTLYERGRLVKSEPTGTFANLVFDLKVKTLPQGGISVTGRSRVDGELSADETAPPTQVVSLTIH